MPTILGKVIDQGRAHQTHKSALFAHMQLGSFITPWHEHPGLHQLLYTSGGVIHVTTKDRAFLLPASFGAWIPEGVHHRIHSNSKSVRFHTIYFQTREQDEACLKNVQVFPVGTLGKEMITYSERWDLSGEGSPVEEALMATIRAFAVEWCSNPIDLSLPSTRQTKLQEVLKYMERRIAAPLAIKDVAPSFGMSPRSMMRLFKRELGLDYGTFKRALRVRLAAEMLSNGTLSVSQIMHAVGYQSYSAFATNFKLLTGVAPRSYTQSNKIHCTYK